MADVRTFKAATMQEALELVEREMGADAVILHTRHVAERRFLPWKKRTSEIEITAGLGINVRPPVAAASKAPRRKAKAVTGNSRQGGAASPANRTPKSPVNQRVNQRTNQGANRPTRQPINKDVRQSAIQSTTQTDVYGAAGGGNSGGTEKPISPAMASLERMKSQLDSVFLSSASMAQTDFAHSRAGEQMGVAAPALPLPPVPNIEPPSEFATKLDSIQRMIENLGRSGFNSPMQEIPRELFSLYTELIDAEVEDDLARDLISKLKRSASPAQLDDATAAKTLLTAMVESEIRCCDPISASPGKRRVVALVGPTGVGKTTTIAKLAANFRLRDSVKMGLVTVDTYRIAAVEQLRTYAEIIDLPMKIVTTPLEMRRALDELMGLELVLIDTAGRSPRDDLQIQELKRLLAEANVDEVHLVLSMTSSIRSLETTAEKFAAAGTTSLIMTKLDEAAGMSPLLSMSRSTSLPISYLTTGQDVPDDIEPATASRIARLVLGQERVFD